MVELTHATGISAYPPSVATAHRIGAGISMIVFPIMLLVGFATHPDLLSFERVTDVNSWIAEWRGNFPFHFGHLLVMMAVPFVIFVSARLMELLHGRGSWYGLIGGVLAIFGAFMLAVDKGALTLTLTAFQEVPDPAFAGTIPALQAMFERGGWLWMTWGYVALPIGFVIQTVGVLREGLIPKWQGLPLIVGLILLMNPDIEIISSTGALLMCVGLLPMGVKEITHGLDRG